MVRMECVDRTAVAALAYSLECGVPVGWQHDLGRSGVRVRAQGKLCAAFGVIFCTTGPLWRQAFPWIERVGGIVCYSDGSCGSSVMCPAVAQRLTEPDYLISLGQMFLMLSAPASPVPQAYLPVLHSVIHFTDTGE